MLAATVLHARSRGWKAGVLVSAGHSLLELLLVAAIVLGAGGLLTDPTAVRTVACAGGTVLLGMGLAAALFPPEAPGRLPAAPTVSAAQAGEDGIAPSGRSGDGASSIWRPLAAGVWTSVTQPYWYLWWAAVVTVALPAWRAAGLAGVGAYYLGHILSDFAWFTAVAAAVGAGGRLLSDRAFRVLARGCGVFLAVFGCAFLEVGILFPELLGA
jgi:threonine/homoserine/homoserine lactone efflux protein